MGRASRGQGGFPLRGGTGMGPRIREDNGWGWIPASVFTGTGSLREDGDGSPHPRGQRVGVDSRFRLHGAGFLRGDGDGSPHPRGQRVGVDSRFRLHGAGSAAGGRGWVPASARTTGGGGSVFTGGRLLRRGWVPASARTFPLPSSRGRLPRGDGDGSSRIREDNGWGWIRRFSLPSSRGQALLRENGLGSGSCSGKGGLRTASTGGECCQARSSPPS